MRAIIAGTTRVCPPTGQSPVSCGSDCIKGLLTKKRRRRRGNSKLAFAVEIVEPMLRVSRGCCRALSLMLE
jgi:hypothetical protein